MKGKRQQVVWGAGVSFYRRKGRRQISPGAGNRKFVAAGVEEGKFISGREKGKFVARGVG